MSKVNYTPPEGFELIYQGGHHDVWCDGGFHEWREGGYAHTGDGRLQRTGYCDCGFKRSER